MAFARDADLLISISRHVTTEWVLCGPERLATSTRTRSIRSSGKLNTAGNSGWTNTTMLFTVGLNIGTPASPIPDCGVTWHHTLPPVVPDLWEGSHGTTPQSVSASCFTTVASWGGYGACNSAASGTAPSMTRCDGLRTYRAERGRHSSSSFC